MSVTNYSINKCQYRNEKLSDVVYFIDKPHPYVDGSYYVTKDSSPVMVHCFNVELQEQDSLDERYKFTKTLKFSVNGYHNIDLLQDKRYVVVKMERSGEYYAVNVDFPIKVTYTYTLEEDTNQTDYTLTLQSNFPTLWLNSNLDYIEPCADYFLSGVKDLYLIEKDYAALSTSGDSIDIVTYSGKTLSHVDFYKNSFQFQETFDGDNVSHTIKFDILTDFVFHPWHYNLLEFLENLYAARISIKNSPYNIFAGFGFGFQPSYEVNDLSTSNNGSSKITVSLSEMSNYGLTYGLYQGSEDPTTYWIYVKYASGYKAYECIGDGIAKYLIKQEILPNGTPTGRYQCLEGYDSMFPNLNIVGHFSITEEFPSQECTEECQLYTTIPSYIEYNSVSCNTYTVSGQCDWNINQLPSYITASPLSGVGNQNYNVEVCNTLTPTEIPVSGSFEIKCGNNSKIVIVKVVDNDYFIKPTSKNINCLPQTVEFTFDNSCPITITSIDPILNYNISYGVLTVTVPSNYTDFQKVWSISAEDCNGKTQTVTIYQDKMYTRWFTVPGYLCDNGNSYTKEEMYSGTSSTDINTPTYEYRPGTLIQSGDTRCQTYITRWSFLNHYYCVNGNKYKALEEEISYDNGTTWTKTGVTKLGELVEQSSEWCNIPVTYEWRLTTKWQCDSN